MTPPLSDIQPVSAGSVSSCFFFNKSFDSREGKVTDDKSSGPDQNQGHSCLVCTLVSFVTRIHWHTCVFKETINEPEY